MAENAQTLTRKEAPPAPVTGRADKSNASDRRRRRAKRLWRWLCVGANRTRRGRGGNMAQIPIRYRNHIQPEKALAQSDCQVLAAPLAIQDQWSVAICWCLRTCLGPLVSIDRLAVDES